MPPNEPITVQQMMPNNVSITVGKKQQTLKNTVLALPNPDYSPTREIDQRRPFWRPDDPQHNRIPGSS
jgi:hypothetical protein